MAKAHLWAFVEQPRERCGWAPDYSGVQSTPGSSGCCSNLAVNGAQGRLSQGKSRHSPPPIAQGVLESTPGLTCRRLSPISLSFQGPHGPGICSLHLSLPGLWALWGPPSSSLWCSNYPVVTAQTEHGGVLGEPAPVRSHPRGTPCSHSVPFLGRISMKKSNMKYHLELTKCFPVFPVSSLPLSHLALMTVLSCCFTVKGK